jgi:deazaflavin-dependent oxidoreductase (nitroreductase family)
MPYYRVGQSFVIVGSNGGQPRNPAWMANLRARNEAVIQVGSEIRRVTSRIAAPEERARLWPELKRWNRNYQRYERKTQREIPVVFLDPAPDASPAAS